MILYALVSCEKEADQKKKVCAEKKLLENTPYESRVHPPLWELAVSMSTLKRKH